MDKPMVFDNYRSGSMYRDFASRQDVENCSLVLDGIMALDDLFAHLDCAQSCPRQNKLNYENMLFYSVGQLVSG